MVTTTPRCPKCGAHDTMLDGDTATCKICETSFANKAKTECPLCHATHGGMVLKIEERIMTLVHVLCFGCSRIYTRSF